MQLKEGSWIMRQTLGSTPVIIGTKIATTYHRGPNYLEVTVDISSNSTAASITNVVAGAVSSLSIWLAFVLEGKRAEHLPERLLGSVCIDHLDLACAKFIDTSKPPPPIPQMVRVRQQHSGMSAASIATPSRDGLVRRRAASAANPTHAPTITPSNTSVSTSAPTLTPPPAVPPSPGSSGLSMLPGASGSAELGSRSTGAGFTPGASRGSFGPGSHGSHAPLGVVTGATAAALRDKARMRSDGESPVSSSTAYGRSAAFELVDSPQQQSAPVSGGPVGESRFAVNAFLSSELLCRAPEDEDDIFHDVCET